MDARRKKLLWRANHRGTKEMDILLGNFAKQHLATMPQTRLDEFEAIIAMPDALLTDWLTGKEPIPDEAMTSTLEEIRQLSFQANDYKKL